MKIKNIIVLSILMCLSTTVLAILPPIITTSPQSQTVKEGDSVTFNVTARANGLDKTNFIAKYAGSMIWVEAGTFMMGSPTNEIHRSSDEIRHSVTLTKGYWLGKYEVTQSVYKNVMRENPSHFEESSSRYSLPVEGVSWSDAVGFCAKLTEMERQSGCLPDGYTYTLPTEAQWEYACRAGSTGSGLNYTVEYSMEGPMYKWGYVTNYTVRGWYSANSDSKTQSVGKYGNWWGFRDMQGNVWEWCLDTYGLHSSGPETDPTGPLTIDDIFPGKVVRGGCYNSRAFACRLASRASVNPNYRQINVGFRVALVQTDPTIDILTYQWYKDGVPISEKTKANSYTISRVAASDSGNYTVTVDNAAGLVRSEIAILTVLTKPKITTHPETQTVDEDSPVTLSVVATGGNLQYQWKRNGFDIGGATNSVYMISNAKDSDAGGYTVTVSNPMGSIISEEAILTFIPKPVIVITTQPESRTVNENEPVTLSVIASGNDLKYQWKQNGVDISGATDSSYTITKTKANDDGDYTVTISNTKGCITSSAATLTVITKPVITIQPENQSIVVDESVTFKVIAEGKNLIYQWYKDGEAISDAIQSSYTIDSIQNGDAGNYTVTVRNTAGYTTSSVAVLTVIGKVVVERSFSSRRIPGKEYILGKTVDVTLTVKGTEKLQFLAFNEVLPSNWTFNKMVRAEGMDIVPSFGASGKLNFVWTFTELPALPFSITYRVNMPSDASGEYCWNGTFLWASSQEISQNELIRGTNSMVVRTLTLIFTGTLYESEDCETWTIVKDAISPYRVNITERKKFFRTTDHIEIQ